MRAIHHRPIYSRFYALAALGFIFGIVYGIFSLALPILAGSVFASIAVLGFVFALPELAGVFLDIPLGAFANRFGRRRTIFYSGILLGLSALVFIVTRHPLLFIVSLILYEVATQAYIIPADAELMAVSPPQRTGRFNGVVEGLHNFGFSIGPVLAGILLATNINQPFWLAAALSVAMIMLSLTSLPREERSEDFVSAIDHVWRRDRIFRASLREFALLGFSGIYAAFLFFIFAFQWGFIAIMEPLYTNALGLKSEVIGLVYAGFTIPFLFVSIWAGRYLDHHGVKGVTVVGLALGALPMIAFGLTDQGWYLFFWALLAGAGHALLLPAVMSVIDHLSSYHTKERISGVKAFAESGGYFLGPLLAGVSAAIVGFQATFISLGIFLAILTLVTIFVPFHIGRPDEAEKT